ncbi:MULTISPECIES: hypothetical protein [Parageobacillus]|nr:MULTISPECIES: hypothetical protein [Parageobacillus]MED4989810.1 hypothetical protein [Parageobacillus toebii]
MHVDGGRLFSGRRCEPELDKAKSGGDCLAAYAKRLLPNRRLSSFEGMK